MKYCRFSLAWTCYSNDSPISAPTSDNLTLTVNSIFIFATRLAHNTSLLGNQCRCIDDLCSIMKLITAFVVRKIDVNSYCLQNICHVAYFLNGNLRWIIRNNQLRVQQTFSAVTTKYELTRLDYCSRGAACMSFVDHHQVVEVVFLHWCQSKSPECVITDRLKLRNIY